MSEYGLGAIFGCPAHDQRDLDFAREYSIDVIPVVKPKEHSGKNFSIQDIAYTEDGVVINSDFLDNLSTSKAKEKIIKIISEKKIGEKRQTISSEIGGYQDKDIGVARYQ